MGISESKRKLIRKLAPKNAREANASDRRVKVAQLLRDGYRQAKISRLLHVSRATVAQDVKKIKDDAVEAFKVPEDGDGGEVHVLNALHEIQDLIRRARNGVETAENPAQQNAFMKTLLDGIREDLNLKMKVGMIRTEPKRVKNEVTVVDGLDVTKASTEELMALYRRKASELPPSIRGLLGGVDISVAG